MIRSDKGPYPRSLSHSPTTLTLVLLHTAGLSRNKSFDRPRGERHASFTIYTHAFSGRRRPLPFIFTRFKEDFRRWKLNREEGGNELSSSFKLNLCPAPARDPISGQPFKPKEADFLKPATIIRFVDRVAFNRPRANVSIPSSS